MKKKKKKNQTRGYSYKLSWVKQFPKKKKKSWVKYFQT